MPTPVFPPEMKPVRPGPYKTWNDAAPHVGEYYAEYSNWNGKFWGAAWPALFLAVQPINADRPSACQHRYWQGRTEEEYFAAGGSA